MLPLLEEQMSAFARMFCSGECSGEQGVLATGMQEHGDSDPELRAGLPCRRRRQQAGERTVGSGSSGSCLCAHTPRSSDLGPPPANQAHHLLVGSVAGVASSAGGEQEHSGGGRRQEGLGSRHCGPEALKRE